jgi:hypothetical protein
LLNSQYKRMFLPTSFFFSWWIITPPSKFRLINCFFKIFLIF